MNAASKRMPLRQRSDYTHKFNAKTGRHGWLRLTPAYSVKVVEEIIADRSERCRILDPFCGTGTTALSASQHGHDAVTTDINPFLIWLASAKTARYTASEIQETESACARILGLLAKGKAKPVDEPPIFNIGRWWSADALEFMRRLLGAIATASPAGSTARTLLTIAFCRTLIARSNAAFNHQSMSFKDHSIAAELFPRDDASDFSMDVAFVLDGARDAPVGDASVVEMDARALDATLGERFDLVVTSPPYANRMSYIRELRPYMYWLQYLRSGRDAGELDWQAIGGTWGIATSRLADWQRPQDRFESRILNRALKAISHADNKNGVLLARYVAKYFDDMWAHFRCLPGLLTESAELHYIVGNSTFYGTLIPTEKLYAEMLAELGFREVVCNPLRKRNSKKELVEYDVVARRGG